MIRKEKMIPLARSALELSNSCCELYKTMNDEQKRELLDCACSNFSLDGKKLTPEWRKPFQQVAEMASCPNWLPGSYSKHTGPSPIARFIEEFHGPETQGPWLYRDLAEFERVNGAKGRQQILPPQVAQGIKGRQRQANHPHPPRIQETLKRAYDLRARLVADPGLTREALAQEIKVNPGQLTRLLRLADLAPDIQRHILALPPSIHRSVVTERRLRSIAKIEDHKKQLDLFRSLLAQPVRAHKRPLAATALPSHLSPAHLGA